MQKAKKAQPAELKPKASEDPKYTPAQQQGLKELKHRLTAKNRFKLQNNEETGKIEAAGDDYYLTQLQALETTGMVDPDASSRLLTQVISGQPHSDSLTHANAAIAFLQGIGPQDELEGMLAGQMVTVHNLAMEYARRAMGQNLSIDVSNSLINRTTKLMSVFTRQVEALQKYRTKGQQKIVVQHVQVSEGGQAIIGDVHQRGGQ